MFDIFMFCLFLICSLLRVLLLFSNYFEISTRIINILKIFYSLFLCTIPHYKTIIHLNSISQIVFISSLVSNIHISTVYRGLYFLCVLCDSCSNISVLSVIGRYC